MLTIGNVIDYIKISIGFPFQIVELDDNYLSDYITKNTLLEFSYYLPRRTTTKIHLEINKVPDTWNKYYIVDPMGLPILRLVKLYFPMGDDLIFGHPPLGPFSQFELREWALNVEIARTVKLFSSFDYTYELEHPNIIRISPKPTGINSVTCEYETLHSSDLSTIPSALEFTFKKLALADVKILLGSIRKRYAGNLRTPFGEIPVNETIGDEGRDEKREILERLEMASLPPIIVDVG